MPRPMAEQVVVVTGASSGIGRATVREFARQGARVVAAARDGQSLDELVAECESVGSGEVRPYPVDVRRYEQMEALAAAAVDRFGRLDTWVNCAAVHEYAWFEDTTPEEFDTVLRTNVLGQVHGAYAALPHLIANDGGGVIIGVSSVEGVRAVPLQAPYVTSKFALRGFYDTIRMEMANRHPNVKVVTILPASIDTPIFENARTKLPNMPMPPKPVYAVVARSIVYAAGHPRAREIPVGGSAVMFILGQRFSPALMDVVFSRKRALMDMQQTELSAQSQDNLVQPPIGSQHTGSDRLEASTKVKNVRNRSIFTEVVWHHPIVKRALVGTAMVAPTALGSWLLSTARRRAQRAA